MKKVVHIGISENGSIDFKIHHTAIDENGEEVTSNIRDTLMPGDDLETKKAKHTNCDFTLLEEAVVTFHTPEVITAYEAWKVSRPSKF